MLEMLDDSVHKFPAENGMEHVADDHMHKFPAEDDHMHKFPTDDGMEHMHKFPTDDGMEHMHKFPTDDGMEHMHKFPTDEGMEHMHKFPTDDGMEHMHKFPTEDGMEHSPVRSYQLNLPDEDVADHHQVYVGVHVPMTGRSAGGGGGHDSPHVSGSTRPSRHASRVVPRLPLKLQKTRYEDGKRVREEDQTEEDSDVEDEGLSSALPPPAAERVKFILGGDTDTEDTSTAKKNVTPTLPTLFTELEELFVYLDGNSEWKETARWYKYEEDVEEGGDRWSKPHVATLSLSSILELRCSLMAGTVILDMDANNLMQIADLVIDNLISCNKLEEVWRAKVRETLLRRHVHQKSSGFKRGLTDIINRRASHPSAMFTDGLNSSETRLHHLKVDNGIMGGIDMKVEPPPPNSSAEHVEKTAAVDENENKSFHTYHTLPLFQDSQETLPLTTADPKPILRTESSASTGRLVYQQNLQMKRNHEHHDHDTDDVSEKLPHLMKKLSVNAEASNVLVGEVDFLEHTITAFVRLSTASNLGDLTEIPVPTRFLFIMLGPELTHGRYHEVGRAISTLMADEIFHDVAYKAKSRDDLIAGIDEFLEQVSVLPPGNWPPSMRMHPVIDAHACKTRLLSGRQISTNETVHSNGSDATDSNGADSYDEYFVRKRPILGGLRRDMSSWRAQIASDFCGLLHWQNIGAILFAYFMLLAYALAIGQQQERATDGALGAREYLLSFLLSGVLFSLFGMQPLLLLCTTLPIIVFETLLHNFSLMFSLEYLPFRLWCGVWTFVLLLVVVATDISNVIGHMTRFTGEVFTVVCAVVLFASVCVRVHSIADQGLVSQVYNSSCECMVTRTMLNMTGGETNWTATATSALPLEQRFDDVVRFAHFRDCISGGGKLVGALCSHGVYFLSVILVLSTIMLALFFSSFRRTGYLPMKLCYLVGDFSVFLTLLILSLVANSFNVNIAYVQVPSYGSREAPWLVSALGANALWTVPLAVVPAFFLTAIVFGELSGTNYCVHRKRNHLTRSAGYHLDLLVISMGVLISSLLGLPFLSAALVPTINNVQALRIDDSDESHDRRVREHRVNMLVVYILLGITPLMIPMLKFIPLPVLLGVLLYISIRALHQIQFVDRFLMLLMPQDNLPEIVYLRQVTIMSMKLFTLFQVLISVALCIIRATSAAVVFPIGLFSLLFVRHFLERLLPLHDVLVLDEPTPKICLLKRAAPKPVPIKDEEDAAEVEEVDEALELLEAHLHRPPERVNVSQELAKTAAWRQIEWLANESSNSPKGMSPNQTENKKRAHRRREKKQTAPAVQDDFSSALPSDSASDVAEVSGPLVNSSFDADEESETGGVTCKKSRRSYKWKQKKAGGSSKTKKDRSELNEQSSGTEANVQLPSPWDCPVEHMSPPRTDPFGLLKIPEDDDVSLDPARGSRDASSLSYAGSRSTSGGGASPVVPVVQQGGTAGCNRAAVKNYLKLV